MLQERNETPLPACYSFRTPGDSVRSARAHLSFCEQKKQWREVSRGKQKGQSEREKPPMETENPSIAGRNL